MALLLAFRQLYPVEVARLTTILMMLRDAVRVSVYHRRAMSMLAVVKS